MSGALQKFAEGGQLDPAPAEQSQALPPSLVSQQTNPLSAMVGRMSDMWGKADQRLAKIDELQPKQASALQAYQQSLITQNQDPNGAFVRGWSSAMLSGHPDIAMESGMNMETQQKNANQARQQASALAGYQDVQSQQAQQGEIYKEQLGSAGSGAMGAMFRYDPNAHVGNALFDKWSGELKVPPDLTSTYTKLYSEALSSAQKIEASNPQAFAQYGGSVNYADKVAKEQVQQIIQQKSIAGGASRTGIPQAQINPPPTPQPGQPTAAALMSEGSGFENGGAETQGTRDTRVAMLAKESASAAEALRAAKAIGDDDGVAKAQDIIDKNQKALAVLQSSPLAAPVAPAGTGTQGLPANGPVNPVAEAGSKEEIQLIKKDQSKYGNELIAQSIPAANLTNILNETTASAQALSQDNSPITPGKFASFKTQGLQWLRAMGATLTPEEEQAVADSTDISKLNSVMASLSAKQTSPRPGVFEFANFLKNNPSMDMTPQSLAKLSQFMAGTAHLSMQMPGEWAAWLNDHPNTRPAEFNRLYMSRRANPNFWLSLAQNGGPATYPAMQKLAQDPRFQQSHPGQTADNILKGMLDKAGDL